MNTGHKEGRFQLFTSASTLSSSLLVSFLKYKGMSCLEYLFSFLEIFRFFTSQIKKKLTFADEFDKLVERLYSALRILP